MCMSRTRFAMLSISSCLGFVLFFVFNFLLVICFFSSSKESKDSKTSSKDDKGNNVFSIYFMITSQTSQQKH
jgi:hypothetical protein